MKPAEDEIEQPGYFELRNVRPTEEVGAVAYYLAKHLPRDKDAPILDLGCGFGQFLLPLKNDGYSNLTGVDLSPEAAGHLGGRGVRVVQKDVLEFLREDHPTRYDFIHMSHVLEHLDKAAIIPALTEIRRKLLAPGGSLFLRVPNAQASTGCYWAYEDFTHSTLFTAGSLIHVLKAAGFDSIEFLDSYDLERLPFPRRLVRKALLRLYHWKTGFWNRVTQSYYHAPSPVIYSWELRCLAK